MSSIAKDKESFLSQGGKALFLSQGEKIPASKNPSTTRFRFFKYTTDFFSYLLSSVPITNLATIFWIFQIPKSIHKKDIQFNAGTTNVKEFG